jgi:hypothetical protein
LPQRKFGKSGGVQTDGFREQTRWANNRKCLQVGHWCYWCITGTHDSEAAPGRSRRIAPACPSQASICVRPTP